MPAKPAIAAGIQKKTRPGSAGTRVFMPFLLACDHLLYKNLSVHFELVQVNPRSNVFAGLGVFAIPVGDVLTARQEQVLDRLASSSITASALQHRHSYQLRQQIVDPQSDAVYSSRIRASLGFPNDERDPGVLSEWVGVILTQRQTGTMLTGWASMAPDE